MFVLQITNPDPFNRPFTFKGELHDVTNKWTIDGTVFEDLSGQLYSIWSGLEEDVPSPQLLYIA
jgi:GH43 family beta-xylosidase